LLPDGAQSALCSLRRCLQAWDRGGGERGRGDCLSGGGRASPG